MFKWLIDRWMDCLIDWFLHISNIIQQRPCSYFELGLPVNGWLAYWLTIWLINWLANCLNGWLTDGPTISLIDWLTVWMVYMYWVMDRLFDGLTDWVTGHPLLKEGSSWSSIQQSSTITSCSYFQSMRKEKVLEKFSAYLTNNNQLSTHQSGNKKLHSTETLNIHLTEHN